MQRHLDAFVRVLVLVLFLAYDSHVPGWCQGDIPLVPRRRRLMGVRPTMRDIARRAGVPVSAVPLVLTNKPGVSPARRARIQAVVQELGYQQRAVPARPTRRHRLGLVIEGRGIPIFTDYYYGEILVGIQSEAKRLGLSLWLHAFDPEVENIDD